MGIHSLSQKRFRRKHLRCRNSRLTAVVLLSLLTTALAPGQAEKDIRSVLEEQVEAWNLGDIEGYMQGYWKSDSTLFASGGEIFRGWNTVFERYKKSYGTKEKMGRLEFGDLKIRLVSHDAAVAYGIWKLYRANDQPWGRFTLIVERKPEGWRITQDHTSSGEK